MGAGIVFLLMGLAVTAFSFWIRGRAKRRFLSWPATPGVVTEQEDAPGTLTTSEQRLQVMHYSYRVGNSDFSGRVQMVIGRTMGEGVRKHAFLDEYPVGRSLDVHYDPSNPSTSMIEAGSEGGILLTLVGAALALIGVVSILTHR